MSLKEIRGHFREVSGQEANDMRFHWLMPGRDMRDGFILLYDDTNFELMKNTILDWNYAEVYVEKIGIVEALNVECSRGNMAGSNLITPTAPTPPPTEVRCSETTNGNEFYDSPTSRSRNGTSTVS
jgi:alpha-galactosidase